MRLSKPARPPLTRSQTKALLAPHEFVRDPLHGDITITALEREIIDTNAFQRLRGLKQLGPTYLVYPGAVHDRLLHSLGTLHCAEQMVQNADRIWSIYNQPGLPAADRRGDIVRIGLYPHLLIRTCALLHDLAHMPYSHTLEDEGHLLPKQWNDPMRVQLWLGEKAEIPRTVVRFLTQSGIAPENAERFVADVRTYLTWDAGRTAEPDGAESTDLSKPNIMELDYPYVSDIVGNTICADLIDYLDRDMFFCGLRDRTGDRVTKYVCVLNVVRKVGPEAGRAEFAPTDDLGRGRGRAVLLTYRHEREHVPDGGLKPVDKPDIVGEAIDLLRRRLALAEKVHFHRTKIAASAMLIAGTRNAGVAWEDIYQLSDPSFISRLQSAGSDPTRHLVHNYVKRRLYRQIYHLRFRPENDSDQQSLLLWKEIYPRLRDPAKRVALERQLEAVSGLKPGSVVIYCPHRRMNLKQFAMLVQVDPERDVKPLMDILDETRNREMAVINDRFAELWSLRIFVDPSEVDPAVRSDQSVQDFSELCLGLIGLPNDILELRGKGLPAARQLVTRLATEFQGLHGKRVSDNVVDETLTAAHRMRLEATDSVDRLRRAIYAAMKTPYELYLAAGQQGALPFGGGRESPAT